MDGSQARLEALLSAVRIAPNNVGGDADQIVSDARKFYDFLNGDDTKTAAIKSLLREEHDVVYRGEARKSQRRWLAWYSQHADWDVIDPRGDHHRMTTHELLAIGDVAWVELEPAYKP
jgi:hypothetical protein